MPKENSRAYKRRRRGELFEQQGGLCHWCNGETVLMDGHIFTQKPPPNLATLDHLRDRYDPTRRHRPKPGESRYVMACFDCNQGRAFKRTMQQPIEVRRARSQPGRVTVRACG